MKRLFFVAMAIMGLAAAKPAFASDPILFDPTGGGGGGVVTTLDWYPGNSLIVESKEFDFATPLIPGEGTVYFQANLSTAYVEGAPPPPYYSAGDAGTQYFTVVAGYSVIFDQTISAVTGNLTTNFAFDPGKVDFFYVYANTTSASNLTGNCFTCGTLVLSGVIDQTAPFTSNFTVNTTAAPVALDQTNANDYPGVTTVTGSGGTSITLKITQFDAAYFPSLVLGQSFVMTNTSQKLPYNEADPSYCFDSNGLDSGAAGFAGDCDIAGASYFSVLNPGYINGLNGNRVLAQTDANSSFIAPAIVPEPTTLSLLGLGLLLGGARLRRRFTAKKA